jgi:hypothetical protein
MSRFHPRGFGWVLALALGSWAVAAQAQEFRYRYVPLDRVELPPGFDFFDPALCRWLNLLINCLLARS